MSEQTVKIACPECGCKEIHIEYGSFGYELFSGLPGRADDVVPAEPGWCYCLRCGVMFNPVQEAFAV